MKHINRSGDIDRRPEAERSGNSVCPPGRAFCTICGALLPIDKTDCVICGGVGLEPPGSRQEERHEIWRKKLVPPSGMRRDRLPYSIASMVLILTLTLSGLGVGFGQYIEHQRIVSIYTAKGAILYRQGQTELKLALPFQGISVPVGSYMGQSAPVRSDSSHDGRYLLYLNNQSRDSINARWLGDLYMLDLIQLDNPEASGEGSLVGVGIVDMAFSDKRDSYAYVTASGDLMLCDYSSLSNLLPILRTVEPRVVDTGVAGIAKFDGQTLLYYKGDRAGPDTWRENIEGESGRSIDLYYITAGDEPTAPGLIASGLYRIIDAARDYSRIIYIKRSRSQPLPLYEIHLYNSQQEPGTSLLMAEDVRHVLSASAAKEEAVYLSPSEETLSFKDLFDDDLLESDILIEEPDPVTYGVLDRYGNEVRDIDPQELDARWDTFDNDMEAYRMKVKRDQLRLHLREQIRAYTQSHYLSYNLNRAVGGAITQLDSHIYNWNNNPGSLAAASVEGDYIIYATGARSNLMRTPISSLAEQDINALLSSSYHLPEALSQYIPLILRYQNFTGGVQDVFTESGPRYLTRFYPTESGDGFYFCSADYATGSGDLYYVAAGTNMSEGVLYVDEDVDAVIGMSKGPQAGLFYQKISRGAFPVKTICHASRSQVSAIAADTDSVQDALLVGEFSDILLFYRGEGDESRKLYIYDSRERYIAQDIEELSFYSPELIYLIRPDEGGLKRLYLYSRGETVLVDAYIGDYIIN